MNKNGTTRVLLLANEFNSAQIMRAERKSGTRLTIVKAETREDFTREMRESTPEVIVAESTGMDGMPLADILEEAADGQPEIPVVVLGEDGEDGRDAISCLDQGAADYIPVSHAGRLPLVIHRLKKDREVTLHTAQLESELQKAHEALLENQKLISIGRLAASIAHEINNPLESITNLLFLLRTEPGLSRNGESYVELAEREMERVAQISKQTLNFYRETRTPVRVSPADLLDEVLVLYSRKLQERQMKVVRQYRNDSTITVYPGEIRQVLSNLVTNAIEASPAGGKLTLRIRPARKWSDEGISGIRIVVADNGSGIAAETRQNLGQLFYTTKGQRGTGLGLWVTRAIVSRYGGEIQLYSSTDAKRHGTVFSVFLPTNMRPQRVLRDREPGGNGGSPSTSKRFVRTATKSAAAGDTGSEIARTRTFRKNAIPLVAS